MSFWITTSHIFEYVSSQRLFFSKKKRRLTSLCFWCYNSDMFPQQPNRSLIDGLLVLQTLTVAAKPIGSRMLARELGLEPTRVNRLAKTLAGLGFLQQTADRKYVVGPGVHLLAAQGIHASSLLPAALPELERLHHYGLTTSLGVVWRSKVSYLYHWQPGMTSAEAVGMSDVFPAATSGIGHALLARLSDDEIHVMHPDFPESVLPQIQQTRERGWAYVCRKQCRMDAALAVAIGDFPSAAISFAGEIDVAKRDELAPVLIEVARRIDAKQREYQSRNARE